MAGGVYERYGEGQTARIRAMSKRVGSTSDAGVDRIGAKIRERLEDALMIACDELDVLGVPDGES